jgi:DNA-binding response OmpR family regulator
MAMHARDPGAEQNERQRVIAALEQAGWVQARAARLLGMTPRQIAYRIQTLNIEVRGQRTPRPASRPQRLLQVADLVFDLDGLQIRRAGQTLRLNPTGQKILELLMRRSPAVVRRELIEEALWGELPPPSDSLRSHIHLLRQAIDKPFARPLLQTIHSVGYRLSDESDGA